MEFIHPWYMVAGGALISSPILIHLINRMRFKRIRWAAMEFLLKSQKRNRRRLIIEQMILLLLRILLVLLAAFLVSRLLYAGPASKGATHIVILDDTASMGDATTAGGKRMTAFNMGKEQIYKLIDSAAQAPSAQNMKVFLLSDMNKVIFEGRLASESKTLLESAFNKNNAENPTFLHLSPHKALVDGRAMLKDVKQSQKILHFVSDFRDQDWTIGPDAEKLAEEVRGIVADEINLNLIDVGDPVREKKSKAVANHDNLAIIDFKPDTRVAIEDQQVEFTVTVQNFGTTELPTPPRVRVLVDGQEDKLNSVKMDRIGPGSTVQHKFTTKFPLKNKARFEISDKDSPEERERKRRLQREFYHVRVDIGPEDAGGLNVDNIRDLVIEVRKKVPTLVVDGNKAENRADLRSDMAILQSFFAASGEFDLEERKLADLEKADLDLYPTIILLNVGEITSPKVLAKLKSYVEQGGSLCYFMGEEIKADHYNSVLYKNGIFPLKIEERPHDPLRQEFPDPEQRKLERVKKRQTNDQPKILFTNKDSKVVEGLFNLQRLFRFVGMDVYWRALPRNQWDPTGKLVEQIVVLPNSNSLNLYQARAKGLIMVDAVKAVDKLADKEAEYKKYVPLMSYYKDKVRDALLKDQLYPLAEELDKMLNDPGVKDDASKPAMPDLWKHPSLRALATEIKEFRETVLFGDPLVVSKRTGKGRVVAMLSPPGTMARGGVSGEDAVVWNNWAEGEIIVQATFPKFMMNLQRFLISEGQAPNRIVGEPLELQFDPARYDRKVSYTFLAQPNLLTFKENEQQVPVKGQNSMTLGADKMLAFSFNDAKVPGLYKFQFTLLGDGPEDDRREARDYAFNVDASKESNLKRATRERLDQEITKKDGAGSVVVRGTGDTFENFKERQPDASESPWLYLFFILILVAEQAMAVHLSFHQKKGEAGGSVAPASPAGAAPAAA
jgi:hypothetical protein